MAKTVKSKKKVVGKRNKVMVDPIVETSLAENTSLMKEKINKNKNLWILIIFVILFGVFLYFAKSLFVVALVNGKPIYRLSLINQLERTNGKTALDSLVNKSLIEQAARKGNVNVSDSEVQMELEKVKKDLEAEGMNLDAALSSQGMTVADFEESLRIKQTLEILLKDNLQVSDEDVKKYFEDNKDTFGEDAKLEDLQESIREQLKSEKLNVEFQTWYNKLKDESDIKYFITF